MIHQPQDFFIGIDEAGRGPLAGPVAVGVVLVPKDFDWNLIPGVGDSKKVTSKNREEIFRRADKLRKNKKLDFAVCMTSAKLIDKIGIVPAIQKAMNQALTKLRRRNESTLIDKLDKPSSSRQGLELDGGSSFGYEHVVVKLDGGLKAPKEYIHQETIIKGDAKEKVIGLASIMAKVTRDRYMVQKGDKPQFAPYHFATHKGYGTKLHRAAIAEHGLSTLHRKSFCKKFKSVV